MSTSDCPKRIYTATRTPKHTPHPPCRSTLMWVSPPQPSSQLVSALWGTGRCCQTTQNRRDALSLVS